MKSNSIIEAHGSITKNVSLIPIDFNIVENTFVAEVGDPYADYYGEVPQRTTPNSLFLFTKQFYTLDEILKISCDMKAFFGYTKKLDVATAILDFTDHYHYAIRVNDFPNYEYILWLQTCLSSEGVIFQKKVHTMNSARATVFKCFTLEKLEEGIYLDNNNRHKGYFSIPQQINKDEFLDILINIRNNNDCPLFDAATGIIDFHSVSKNMIRLFSENLNLQLLKCAKEKFSKYLLTKNLQEH
jgi:hypothetical protein